MSLELSTAESIGIITGSVIGVITFLLAIATVLGGNFRVARNAKIVADYEAAYKALTAKSTGQEQQMEELRRENGEKDSRITELQHEVADLHGRLAVLQEVVTGKSAIEELATKLAAMADAMNRRTEAVNNRVGETLAMVGELRIEIRAAHTDILAAVTPGDG